MVNLSEVSGLLDKTTNLLDDIIAQELLLHNSFENLMENAKESEVAGIRIPNLYPFIADIKEQKEILEITKFHLCVRIEYSEKKKKKKKMESNDDDNAAAIKSVKNSNSIFSGLPIQGIVDICLRCNTKEDAENILRQYEEYCATPEIAHINLGYIFGYVGDESRKKLYSLFPVNHPAFGEKFGRNDESEDVVIKDAVEKMMDKNKANLRR